MQESGPGEKQELFLIDFSISSYASEYVQSLWVAWECFALCMARNDRPDRVMLANK